jgi:hypothetical protein
VRSGLLRDVTKPSPLITIENTSACRIDTGPQAVLCSLLPRVADWCGQKRRSFRHTGQTTIEIYIGKAQEEPQG